MSEEVKESGTKAGPGKSRQGTVLPEELLGHTEMTPATPEQTQRDASYGSGSDDRPGLPAEPGKGTRSTRSFDAPDRRADPIHTIGDQKFNKDLATLRGLHSFLIREATTLPENFSLGELNCLKADGATDKGRPPSDDEWQAVEKKTQVLFALLTDTNRKRFLVSQMPDFLPRIAVWLVAVSIGSMILSVLMAEVTLYSKGVNVALMVLFFLLWLMSLGAIGSAAFIGFNAISVTSDITFDISDTRLIVQRIVLGALFALFFTLPFGFHEFLSFVKSLSNSALNRTTVPTRSEIAFTNQSLLLIMPFVLGYSTSLVILILNRMISAASTLFGAQPASAKSVSK
ncbi:hypothetical protein [Roseibium marinum]|uniref:Uncharacterized protein n=1 Tax=Roseibium marinum TaxID=281252 RepID=A0A2S3UR97_9HYPH|nr:hypothetical protein [Roseibium marinum]POF30238.1 hypothetical protein CLV41_107269 [Roseibium marinum]